MSKTIFIIGANSAVAKETVRGLAGSNTVITGGRKNCDVICDITQPITIPEKVDVVINFAAAFGGNDDNAIKQALDVNVRGLLNICMASKKAGVRHIVNISSLSAVLGTESPYYSIYALTKRNGDELADLYCKLNDMPLTILRPSQIYGNDVSLAAHQPLIYHMFDKAEKGEDITIYGKHDALRNYLHVTDLGETISRVVAKSIQGTYACLYPADMRISEIAHAAQKVFGKGGTVLFQEDQPDIPDNVFDLDTSIYEKIDYYPQITLEQGIQEIKAYREGAKK